MDKRPIALVVEDDLVTSKVIATVLTNEGFEVVTRATGVSGIRAHKQIRPHVAFVDLGLPDLSGMDVISMMLAIDEHIPVIIMTAQPTVSTAISALNQNIFAYLVKPLSKTAIVDIAHKAVEKERATKRLSATSRSPVLAPRSIRLSNSLELLRYVFQAVVDVRGAVYGYEALVRSNGPLATAEQLVGAAEEQSRESELLQRGHETIAHDFRVSNTESDLFVNISPENLTDRCLRTGPLSEMSQFVILELPTTKEFHLTSNLIDQSKELKDLGYRIALDNVVHERALLRFSELSPDFVKVDRSIVQRSNDNTDLRNIVQKTKEIGALCLALGVETQTEYDLLLEEGCDLFQGYLFAWPAPLSGDAAELTSGSVTLFPGAI